MNLTNQDKKSKDLKPYIKQLTDELDARSALWNKLPPKKRKKIIKDDKDPVIKLAYKLYKDLKAFFDDAESAED